MKWLCSWLFGQRRVNWNQHRAKHNDFKSRTKTNAFDATIRLPDRFPQLYSIQNACGPGQTSCQPGNSLLNGYHPNQSQPIYWSVHNLREPLDRQPSFCHPWLRICTQNDNRYKLYWHDRMVVFQSCSDCGFYHTSRTLVEIYQSIKEWKRYSAAFPELNSTLFLSNVLDRVVRHGKDDWSRILVSLLW